MPPKIKLTPNEKNLIRRYLVWCYKSTKEELDRIDRKFTQLKVDDFILSKLSAKSGAEKRILEKSITEFKQYITQKQESAAAETLTPQHIYLKNRFSAVEDAAKYFLGAQELAKMVALYEQEMTTRILQAREH